MTQISISDLQNQDLKSLLVKEKLINAAIDRALDSRKITGGLFGVPIRLGGKLL
jgi:ABC-type multidrug transport system permease subunit